MTTGTAGTTAREYHTSQVHYLRKRILGAGGNATYTLGILPAGANVLRIGALNRVVLSGGTPAVTVGPAASPASWVASTTALTATAGRLPATLLGAASLGVDADTTVSVVISGTPTAGTTDIELEYTVNNDG